MSADIQPNFFLKRPVLSIVISLLIVMVGGLAMKVLPIEQYPQLTPPQITVTVYYPGASADTIASTVLAPLETNINGVEGMLYMVSNASSSSGSGTINVYFKLGTDPDMALVNVNNRVNLAQTMLPESVRRQGVSVLKRSSAMLQVLAMYSPSGRYDEVFLHNFMQTKIIDELKRLEGVGDAAIWGQLDYTMRINLSPDKMAKYNLTAAEISAAISEQNSQYAPGRMGDTPSDESTQLTWQIDTQGRLVTPEEFENIIIKVGKDNAILRLKDVARVELAGKDYSIRSKINGLDSREAAVYLLPGANAIETGKRVEARLEELSKSFPEGVECKICLDTNDFVMESIKEVVKTLEEAMVLVFIVVFLFLQNWRATLIPCIAVPVSIIGTFAGMYALGFSINTLTLFGMVLAIGIVVDDAIVVLENVERIMTTEHLPPREATAKAMAEVTGPVVAIVLVLCAVFIPVSFMGGLAGEMFKQFAITISVSVVLSGIVALTLTPALCAALLKPHKPGRVPNVFFRTFDACFEKLTNGYVSIVAAIKNSPFISLVLFGCMVGCVAFLFRTTPTGLVPDEDQGYMLGMAVLPDGASLHRSEKIADAYTQMMKNEKSIKDCFTISGLDLATSSYKSNYMTFFAVLKPWDERTAEQTPQSLVNKALALTAILPEPYVMGFTPPPITGMSNTGGVEAFIQCTGSGSIYDIEAMATRFAAEASKRPEIDSVRNLFSTGSLQLYAKLDRERCKVMQISIADVFNVMAANFGTAYVNDFNYIGKTFQVRMTADRQYRMTPENLKDLYVRNAQGDLVPLSVLITLERRTAPQVMERYNAFPGAHIMGTPAAGYSSGEAIQAMEEVAAEVLTSDYNLGWISTALQEKLASSDTVMVFVLALVMVFLILAAQYESWTLPIAVLTAVPFGVFGAILATWLRGLTVDVYFQVALITLVGLAAKNAILIVEFAVEAWRDGRSLDEAALHASRLRFRPIVMTSLAFILGCVPLAVSVGAGANSRHAIGTAVVGGMLAATCIATLFVPYFFKAIMALSLKLRGKTDPNAKNSRTSDGKGIAHV